MPFDVDGQDSETHTVAGAPSVRAAQRQAYTDPLRRLAAHLSMLLSRPTAVDGHARPSSMRAVQTQAYTDRLRMSRTLGGSRWPTVGSTLAYLPPVGCHSELPPVYLKNV